MAKKPPRAEKRTREEILKHVESHFKDGRRLAGFSYLESPEGAIRIIPTGVSGGGLEAIGINLHEVSEIEADNMYRFCEKCDCVAEMVMILSNIQDDCKRLVMPKESSKYFNEGRKKMRRKIQGRMKPGKARGRMITLTYNPRKVDREVAWRQCGNHLSAFMDRLKMFLARNKAMKKIQYFWVLEEQTGTGYPHFHIFVRDDTEDFRGYVPEKKLTRMWGKGRSHIKKAHESIKQYIQKYISKVEGMSINAMAHMWKNKRRLYGFSREYIIRGQEYEKRYDLIAMYHPVKGIGVARGGSKFDWCGNVPFWWLLSPEVENRESTGYEKLKGVLWDSELDNGTFGGVSINNLVARLRMDRAGDGDGHGGQDCTEKSS